MEEPGEGLTTLVHQLWVYLVIDKSINFQNAIAKILPITQDSIGQCFHNASFSG